MNWYSKKLLPQGGWQTESKRTLILERILLINFFLTSLMLATSFVSVKYFGKYTISYIPDFERIIISFAMVALIAVALPARINRIDKLLVWLLVLFAGVPMLVPYALGGASQVWMCVSVVFWILLGIQTRLSSNSLIVFPRLRGGWVPLILFFGVVVVYSLYTAVFFVGLTPTFDFSEVYKIREEYVSKDILLGNYTYKWVAFIAAPFVFIVGLVKKNLFLMVCGFSVSLVLFFATGHKTYLFALPFVYIVFLIWSCKRPARWLTLGLSTLMLAGIGSYHLFGDVRLNASFMNRLYVIPAKISYEYHDYFSDHKKTNLSHSILSKFIEYPYSDKPAHIISEVYYDDPDGYPNTGILADAYMNFGYAGVIALLFLVVFILRIIIWLSRNKDQSLVIAMLIMPIFAWVNSGFLTSFMTSGLAFGLIGIWLLPATDYRNHKFKSVEGGRVK